jgi:signal transduction histidine kinase
MKTAHQHRREGALVARAAHELRTPLNNILVLAELMAADRQGRLTPRQSEFVRLIRSSCSDVLALVDELLDLARLESGGMSAARGAVSLEQLREYAERGFRHAAESKGLNFSAELDPALPAGILSDERRLRQILNNLLGNAVKFTERGAVRLRVYPKGDNVAFEVSDTGIGIPKDKHRLVFEPFEQAGPDTHRRYGGAGLGLSISRDLAGLPGWRLTLESEPGRGSTFTLLLPARRRKH